MSHSFTRPVETHLKAPRHQASGHCGECGSQALARYRVLSEGGFWNVVKCQDCLASISRERGPLFGSYTPFSFGLGKAQ